MNTYPEVCEQHRAHPDLPQAKRACEGWIRVLKNKQEYDPKFPLRPFPCSVGDTIHWHVGRDRTGKGVVYG